MIYPETPEENAAFKAGMIADLKARQATGDTAGNVTLRMLECDHEFVYVQPGEPIRFCHKCKLFA